MKRLSPGDGFRTCDGHGRGTWRGINLRAIFALAGYATAITTANWMTNLYGVVPVGGGLSVTAGTFAAGTGLLARDAVQDTAGRAWVLVGVAAGTALTAVTSPALALASAGAFLAAETIDMVVYTPLRHRGWARAVLASNTVGAALDTLLFLWLSGLPVTASSVGGQLIGKVAWATVLPVITVLTVRQVRRALPRHSLGA